MFLEKNISIGYQEFGSVMPGRSFSSSDYRFGFNGQEKVDEVYNVSGSYLDFTYRGYNSRLGRFMAVDPIANKYPMLTPYQFAGNTPIWARELEGLEPAYSTENGSKSGSDHTYNGNSNFTDPNGGVNQTEQSKTQNAADFSNFFKSFNVSSANTTVSKSTDTRTQGELQKDKDLRTLSAGIKQGQQLQGPVVSGGPGFGVGLANDPFVQTAAISLLTGGISNAVGLGNLSFTQQFLARSSTDILLQTAVKGDFNQVDLFDATISGIGFKSSPFSNGLKTFFDYNASRGLLIKTNASQLLFEFGTRTATDKFFGAGTTGNKLVDDVAIGFIKKKVNNDASQFKGKIGFGF